MKKRILIIDDEVILASSLREGLKDLGYEVETAFSGEEGLDRVVIFQPHLVFLDLRLPAMGGIQVLKEIKNIDKNIEVVMMTAYADTKTAVSAIKLGAYDYLNKPFELDQIAIMANKVLENISLRNQTFLLNEDKKRNITPIIGEHPSMLEVLRQVKILARHTDTTVLIRGETGTGKGRLALDLHYLSARRDRPFVEINCGAIPENLLESELFGFEKNAFTGAQQAKKGLLELADGGTVFLDEIGELSSDMQVKLLKFLDEKRFKRIGGLREIEVDVRVITATNSDLETAIKQRTFREDLYYRLNVVPIYLPPLRERGNDIITLAQFFFRDFSKKMGKDILDLSEEVKEVFLRYRWPGNIRELRNVAERITILYNIERVEIQHLPLEIREGFPKAEESVPLGEVHLEPGLSLETLLEEIERKYIAKALEKAGNNITRAAEMLGMSRYALQRRLEKYNMHNG